MLLTRTKRMVFSGAVWLNQRKRRLSPCWNHSPLFSAGYLLKNLLGESASTFNDTEADPICISRDVSKQELPDLSLLSYLFQIGNALLLLACAAYLHCYHNNDL